MCIRDRDCAADLEQCFTALLDIRNKQASAIGELSDMIAIILLKMLGRNSRLLFRQVFARYVCFGLGLSGYAGEQVNISRSCGGSDSESRRFPRKDRRS